MKNTNLRITAGDWRGKTATIYRSFWAKRLDCMKISNGWFRRREIVDPDSLASVCVLHENERGGVASMAKGGIVGAVVAGPLGAAAGALVAGSRRSKILMRVTLTDGRSLVLEGTSKDFTTLFNATLENECSTYYDAENPEAVQVDSLGCVSEWRSTARH